MDSLRLALTLLFSVSIVNAKPHLRHLTTAECDYAAVGGSNESECSAAPATPTEHPLTCSARVNFTETTYYNFFNGTVRDESDDVKYNQTILSFHQVDQVVVFQAGLLFTPGEAEIVVLDNNRGALAFGARCSENDTLEVRYYFPDCKGYTALARFREHCMMVLISLSEAPFQIKVWIATGTRWLIISQQMRRC